MTAVLSAFGLVVRYRGVAALAGVDIAVAAGEIVGVVGSNGAGKTTLLDCLSGHTVPSEGRVVLDSVEATAMRPERRARRGVARTFQDCRLFPTLSVAQTLLLAQETMTPGSVLSGLLGLPRWRAGERRRMAAVSDLARSWGLEAALDQPVGELTTGVRRLVDLACVEARQPRVVLLDEPSAGLAAAEAEALGPALARIRDLTGASVIMVEHDLPLVWRLADRIVVLEAGQVVALGPPSQLRDHPSLSFRR